ncbi:DNA-binding protein [Streptomyces sp. NPDC057555]|uniref:DNA-binding protein n=1 Tax=Streptomyces sp. NPDC057555 TaxID=3346166 RepID=UPI00369702BA
MDPATAGDAQLSAVHAQLVAHYGASGIPPELRLLFGAPDLLCATWVAFHESLVAGRASRTDRELVAAGVARAGRCAPVLRTQARALDAGGHPALARAVRAGGTPEDPGHARLLAWGAATAAPKGPPAEPPFPAVHAPEFLGAALTAHFLTRLGSALVSAPAPGGIGRWPWRLKGRRAAARSTAERTARPGDSLSLLAGATGPAPSWAGGAPLGAGLAALRSAAAADGGAGLTDTVRTRVAETVAEYGGRPPTADPGGRQPAARAWLYAALSGLRGTDRPAAAVALLTALAPAQLAFSDVEFWRVTAPEEAAGDAALLRLAAFGAYTAVECVERRLVASTPGADTHPRS